MGRLPEAKCRTYLRPDGNVPHENNARDVFNGDDKNLMDHRPKHIALFQQDSHVETTLVQGVLNQ